MSRKLWLVLLVFVVGYVQVIAQASCSYDGRMLVYNRDDGSLVMRDADDPNGEITLIHEQGRRAVWSPDGCTLAYYSEQTIIFWSDGRETALEGVYPDLGVIDWSPDSGAITFDAYADGLSHIFVANLNDGTVRQITTYGADPNPPNPPGNSPQWSPRGDQIAYIGLTNAVYVIDVASGETRALDAAVSGVSWSPDGRYLTYIDHAELYTLERWDTETGAAETLFTSEDAISAAEWSADGARLMFEQHMPDPYFGGVNVIRVIVADTGAITRAFLGQNPRWSPDGTSIAYHLLTYTAGEQGSQCTLMILGDDQTLRALDSCRVWSFAWHPSA